MTVETLESLLQHPGWRWFWEDVATDWGPNGVQFRGELERALNLTDDHAAAAQARQIYSSQKVIMALPQRVSDALARLKRAESHAEPHPSRRGGL